MTILSDRFNQAVDTHTDQTGRTDLTKVAADVKPTLTDDERERYVDRGVMEDARRAATRGKASVKKHAAAHTLSLFPELHRGYAIDGDETYIKNTDDLVEIEMKRVIDLRKTQVEHDNVHIGHLERAYIAAKPIWAKHPGYTFGQCCKVLRKQARRKKVAPSAETERNAA